MRRAMRRFSPLAMVILLPMLAAGCGSSETTSSAGESQTATTHAATGWTGYGAKVADWASAHEQGAGCAPNQCSGPTVQTGPNESEHEFTSVDAGGAEDRIDGYTQALGESVIPAAAKQDVLALLPRDTHTLDFWVEHGTNGSCGLWNVQSATLAHWLADPKIGDPQGVLGIDLYKPNANGESEYSESGVAFANVTLAKNGHGTGC